ncbi:Helicase ATP-binding domain-containing protein, partial [Trichostrongylus colubriformis]
MENFNYTPMQRRGSKRRSRRTNRNPWTDGVGDDPGEYGVRGSPNTNLAAIFKSTKRKREKVVIDNTRYESLPMCGYEVRLPLGMKPYPSQKLMMVRMITALTKKLNFLAESPTGSGKTMALLASSCAWLDDYRKKRRSAVLTCPIHGEGSGASYASTKQEPAEGDL